MSTPEDQPTAPATPSETNKWNIARIVAAHDCNHGQIPDVSILIAQLEAFHRDELAEAKAEVAELQHAVVHVSHATDMQLQTRAETAEAENVKLRARVAELQRLLGEVYRNTNLRHHPELTGLADIVSKQLSQ